MRVGVLSDSHDRVPAVAALLQRMAESGVGLVLHAGDFCAPFVLAPFRETGLALAGVFGRNDGDREGLRAAAAQGVGMELYESPHSVELAGQRILVVHDLADIRSLSIEAHSVVVHGFTHQAETRTSGDTLLVNPGEACGWLHGTPSAAILDLETRQVEPIQLVGPEWRF